MRLVVRFAIFPTHPTPQQPNQPKFGIAPQKDRKVDREGEGGGGANPYSQPDPKKSVLYDFLIVPDKIFVS